MVEPATLEAVERALVASGETLAVFLVYDRPERESERPGLKKVSFAQRCQSDEQLDALASAYRDIGAYVELFAGERPFIDALASGRLVRLGRERRLVFNGIGWGVGPEGFMPGRKSLIPLLADSYGLTCVNADAYACALTLHKFHSFVLLRGLGVRVPSTWQFRSDFGWVGQRPADGTRVIAKSTFEAWSVGVTADSIFVVDHSAEARISAIEQEIGQAVTVQEFVPGEEVCVPVVVGPSSFVAPPVQATFRAKSGDPDAVMTIADTLSNAGYSHHPYECSAELRGELESTALDTARMLALRGLCRFDFRVDGAGTPWLFDVAIEPGIGLESSAFRAFERLGWSHDRFVRMVGAASLWDDAALTA